MEFIFELLIAFFLIVSGIFGFVGSFGMIKLKDPMSRLHAPTKATTLGVGGVLLASIFHSILIEQRLSMHELLITLFLFLTAPITANFVAKAYMARNVRRSDLPESGGDYGWSIYDDPPESPPAQ